MKLIFLIVGVALLGLVITETDITEAVLLLREIGWGFGAILAIYFVAFVIDTYAWQLTTPGLPLDLKWHYRFFQVRLAGEAFNTVTPTASMGGEAVKAVMLKNHYGIDYRDGTASLILAKTLIVASLVAFLAIGFALMLGSPKLDMTYKVVSGAGLAAFAVGVGLFIVVQRYKITSAAGTALSRNRWFAKLNDILHPLREVEDRLIHFYTRQPKRLVSVLVLNFINWALGIAEVWTVMYLIGSPISFADAWIIESVAQLVRSATFFIPASIGAQEGAFLIAGAAITGQPSFGLTVAIARRVREIVWAIWGLAVFYMLKPRLTEPQL
jgi:uncharacterized protein (TIRG00374 family)